MPRCNGYRATKATRDEIAELRAELHTLRAADWQRATRIMQTIGALLGHAGGPTGGMITPRSCRYCGFYGHTRQHCKKLAADNDAAHEREVRGETKRRKSLEHIAVDAHWEKWLAWSDARYRSMRPFKGCEVEERELYDFCEKCDGCLELNAHLAAWEAANPEPVKI